MSSRSARITRTFFFFEKLNESTDERNLLYFDVSTSAMPFLEYWLKVPNNQYSGKIRNSSASDELCEFTVFIQKHYYIYNSGNKGDNAENYHICNICR